MKVLIKKVVYKTRKPYSVPAKYSSNTFAILYIDGVKKGEFQVNYYGSNKKLMEHLMKKFNFTEYEVKKGLTIYT